MFSKIRKAYDTFEDWLYKKVNSLPCKAQKGVDIASTLLVVYCWYRAIVYFCDYNDGYYETFKDMASARGTMFFVLGLVIIGKVRLINWQTLLVSAVYWPLALLIPASHEGSEHLIAIDQATIMYNWLMIVILIDMLLYKKYRKFNTLNKSGWILYLLTFVYMILQKQPNNEVLVFACPFILFFLMDIPKKGLDIIVEAFGDAWCLAFLKIIYRSYQAEPDIFGVDRWFGSFLNIGAFGMFLGGCFAVALFRILQAKERVGRKSFYYVVAWLYMLAVTVAMLIVDTRTLWFGVLGGVFFAVFFTKKEMTAKQAWKRLLIAASCAVALVMLGTGAMALMNTIIPESERAVAEAQYPQFGFWWRLVARANYVFCNDSSFDGFMFPVGTLINGIDLFTSGRLSLAVLFLKNTTLNGQGYNFLTIGWYIATNAHCQYIEILYAYGWLAGGMYLVWFFKTVVASVTARIRSKNSYTLLSVIWMGVLLGLFTGETATLYFPVVFMGFVTMLPMMANLDDCENKGETDAA